MQPFNFGEFQNQTIYKISNWLFIIGLIAYIFILSTVHYHEQIEFSLLFCTVLATNRIFHFLVYNRLF
jgi:hypothetical protein